VRTLYFRSVERGPLRHVHSVETSVDPGDGDRDYSSFSLNSCLTSIGISAGSSSLALAFLADALF
jgi:hypothetical protein